MMFYSVSYFLSVPGSYTFIYSIRCKHIELNKLNWKLNDLISQKQMQDKSIYPGWIQYQGGYVNRMCSKIDYINERC